jgi:hypothetical protein
MSLAKCLSQLDTTYLLKKLVDQRLDFLRGDKMHEQS